MSGFYQSAPQKKAFLLSAVAVLVAAGLIYGVVFYILSRSVNSEERVEVVSVYNTTENSATQMLRADGLKVEIRRATNIEISKGLVYEQNPLPGSKVNPGQVVILYISEGAERQPVPQVVGFEQVDAKRILTSKEYGYLVEVASEDSPETLGVVIRQDPTEGELLAAGETIHIFVSSGIPRVPDVRLQPVASAIAQLSALGFETIRQFQPHDEILEDFVINTRPGPGLPLTGSQPVVVLVSTGRSSALVLPNVEGLLEGDATLMLGDLGFVVEVTYRNAVRGERVGIVTRQTPQPTSSIEFGAKIRLVVTSRTAR